MSIFHKLSIQNRWAFMLMLFCGLIIQDAFSQSGNFVPSGGEAVNYGTISLGTSTAWSTARTATPGYFAASGTATYTNASDANNINGYVKHYVKAANQVLRFQLVRVRTCARSPRVVPSQTASAWRLPGLSAIHRATWTQQHLMPGPIILLRWAVASRPLVQSGSGTGSITTPGAELRLR